MGRSVIHVVHPGDCIESVAARAGCDWRSLWRHSANAKLRERRPNPNLLVPGDVIHVPGSLLPTSRAIQAGGTHRFSGERPFTTLRLRLLRDGDSGEPLANVAFQLRCETTSIEGTTDGDGALEVSVPASAHHATVRLEPGSDRERILDLAIGHLDPIDEPSGIAQRLSNLGLLPSTHTEDEVQQALEVFKSRHDLEGAASGPDVLARLREEHDGR